MFRAYRDCPGISIVWKLTIVAATSTILAVAAASWCSFQDSRALLINATVHSMEESMSRQVERMSGALDQIRDDALLVSQSEAVSGVMRARANGGYDDAANMTEADWHRQLERVFGVMVKSRGYLQMRLIGLGDNRIELVRVDAPEHADGSVRFVRGDDLQEKGGRDYYVVAGELLGPGQTFVSPIELNRDRGVIEQPWQPTLRAVAPVYQTDTGQPTGPVGIIVISADGGEITDLIERDSVFEVSLANEAGGILRHPDPARQWGFEFDADSPGIPDEHPQAWKSLTGGRDGVVWNTEDEKVHVVGRVPLGGSDRFLALIMTAHEEDVLAEIAGLRAKTTAVSLVAVLATCGICVLVVRRLIRPIRALTAQADELASGVKDVRLTISGKDEVGRLGRAFSNLVEQLRERTEEAEFHAADVRSLNASLEQKVELRTAALAESETYIRAVLMSMPDPIVTIDAKGIVREFNPAAERTFGFTATEVIGQSVTMLMPPSLRSAHLKGLARYNKDHIPSILGQTIEVQGLRKDGSEFPLELAVEEIVGTERHLFTAIGRDITDRKKAEEEFRENSEMMIDALYREKQAAAATQEVMEQLAELATTDKLTGLPNRRVFLDHLDQTMKRSRRDGGKFAVLFFDFDRFKVVNDSLGHDAGDALLCDIGDIFRKELRETDMVARFGGDEFVVLLTNLSHFMDARKRAERLLSVFAEPHQIGEHLVVSTASIGMVTSDRRYEKAGEMIRDADAAMYQAKDSGRGKVVEYDAKMHAAAMSRLTLEQGLRTAVANEELRLLYQPIVELDTGELTGFEALIRWEHPERGVVSPVEFIPIAEDTGLIVEIGLWVLRTAAQQIAEWNRTLGKKRILTMNVNVSKRQLLEASFFDNALECQRQHGLQPGELKLEITESTIAYDTGHIIPLLENLRDHGFSIAMDDFGTGVSSLSTLHKYPIDMLKIDRSFIVALDGNRSLLAVVASITALAENLGINTVAEGIESEDIVGALQSIECKWGQGYHFAKPLTAAAAEAFIQSGNHGKRHLAA